MKNKELPIRPCEAPVSSIPRPFVHDVRRRGQHCGQLLFTRLAPCTCTHGPAHMHRMPCMAAWAAIPGPLSVTWDALVPHGSTAGTLQGLRTPLATCFRCTLAP